MSKGRDALREMSTGPRPATPAPQRPLAGAVRAVGVSLDRMSQNTQALREQLEQGDHVVELDPAMIEQAFVSDRLDIDNDPDFESLKQSIAEHGQQVPILVRRHPDVPDRYQIAFGRRRTRAAGELGRPVRAIVKRLSDPEMVIAQGKENGDRKNLSFIERALFALQLEASGFDRQTIIAALSVDTFELSRLRGVANGVSREVIQAIGPAPRAGRPRWQQLALHLADKRVRERVDNLIAMETFRAAPTDERFAMVLAAATPKRSKQSAGGLVLKSSDGRTLARVNVKTRDQNFVAFLEAQLPDVVSAYERQRKPPTS